MPGNVFLKEAVPNKASVRRAFVSASQRLAWLLAMLASLTFEVAVADGECSAWAIALLMIGQAVAVLCFGWIARRVDSRAAGEASSRLIPILCLAFVPFVVELLVRGSTQTMLPLELLLLAGFRNVVLVLATFSHRASCQRMCCSLSTFLTIFASALSTQLWLHGLVVVFAIIGIWWLMGTYWETLQGRLAASSEQELPRRWLIALPLMVLVMLIGLPVAATQTHALRGFMPSSGGTDWYDPNARSGVGDGDALVAGTDNIQSFAPIEDAPFLNSHEPSLYDLFDDTYNEPIQPKKQERAIALPKSLAANQKNHDIAESKQAGRQFSTLRQPGAGPRQKIGSLDSNALFYVKGRVPLHLKLEVFDRYDGIDWFPEELRGEQPRLTMESLHDRPWLRPANSDSLALYGLPETHALKIVGMDTNRIPSPTQWLGVHIDKVDRAELFAWAQSGIVKMDREQLPALTVIHVQSRTVDERLIPQAITFWSGGSDEYRQFGDGFFSRQVRELAKRWTEDVASGWPQVRAIVGRLREHYVLDHAARPPADCQHTAAHFLLSSRRGPDYQFASAAVVLLRSLGMSARVVSGFHVEPSRYDPRAQHTPVFKDDVHFWAEVHSGGGNWIPLEPTPGYELLGPPPTLAERTWRIVLAVGRFLTENALELSLLLMAVATGWIQRRRVADLVATVCWRLWPVRDDRRFALQTLRLLDARCRRAGCARPRDQTSSCWLRQVALHGEPATGAKLVVFARLAAWAAFARSEDRSPIALARQACCAAERALPFGMLRKIHAANVSSSDATSSSLNLRRHPSRTAAPVEDSERATRLTRDSLLSHTHGLGHHAHTA